MATTTEQKYLDEFALIVKKFYHDPVGYVRAVYGAEPSWQQAELMNAVAKHKKVTCRSGHNIGKSTSASWLSQWFSTCRPYPKIICTANSKEQLYDVLWAEQSKWMRKSPMLSALFTWNKDKIFFNGSPEEWWAVARTAGKQEALAGRHADHQMIIVDEASGLDDGVFEASAGLMSGKNIYVLLISNPTRNSGYFRITHTPASAKMWKQLHFSSLDSPLVDKSWLQFMKDTYGENSNQYRVRVLGDFPTSDADAVIPYQWVEAAIDRDIQVNEWEPLILGVDVGAGGDKSVILHRRGARVERIAVINTSDTMVLAEQVVSEARKFGAYAVCIDPIGVGKGAADWLSRQNICNGRIFHVDVRRASFYPNMYRLRDELWWKAREQFERGTVSIPYDEDLILELHSVKYNSENGIKVDPKRIMKRDIGHSPDKADAYCLSLYVDESMIMPDDEEEESQKDERKRNRYTGY